MNGHVWICVGVCGDGSTLILHSTPSPSKSGNPGGGVQLSAIAPYGSSGEKCQALQLANEYMSRYYPTWSERYQPIYKDFQSYVTSSADVPVGKFSWYLDKTGRGLSNPDGYAKMTADEILKDLFAEK